MTDIDVFKKYGEILQKYWKAGLWIEYVSIETLAVELNTTKYQIRKAYKSLVEKGYMKLDKVCTYSSDYDNGLYSVAVPILFTKVYVISDKGNKVLKELLRGEDNE